MRQFKPTWLYVKRHSITGLLYFGKTTIEDPRQYLGSGKYWKNHLNVHGKYIETVWCELFIDYDNLTEFAELFSYFFDIVKSDKWANLIAENGLDGGSDKGRKGHSFSEESRRKISLANAGRIVSNETCRKISDSLTGRKLSEETKIKMSKRTHTKEIRQKISDSSKGRVYSEESRQKMSEAKKGRKRNPMTNETREKISKTMLDKRRIS
jgi:NUMOD3 motif